MVRSRQKPTVGELKTRRASLLAPTLALLVAGCSTTFDGALWDGPDNDGTDSDDEGTQSDSGTGDGDGDGDGDDGTEGDTSVVVPECDPSANTQMWLDLDDGNTLVSPVLARAAIEAGEGLGEIEINLDEFLNYYSFEYEAAADTGQLGITPELYQPDLDPAGEWVLQVSVSGDENLVDERPPAHLTFVLDTSNFADAEDIEIVRESVEAMASSLRFGDVVSIVLLGQDAPIVLDAYEVQQASDPALLDAVTYVEGEGDPQLDLALETAYALAFDTFDPFALNRVVYVGGDLGGVTPAPVDLIESYAGMPGDDGVLLVAAGLGKPLDYDPALVNELSTAGRGSSSFVDDADEAWRVFGTDFVSTIALAAHEVSVRVELPPGFRPVGAVDATHPSEIPEVDANPQSLAANRPLVFHERLESCAPEGLDSNSELEVFVTWIDASSGEARETSQRTSFGEAMQAQGLQLHKGRAVVAYASALADWQDAMTPAAQQDAVLAGLAVVEEALESLPEDPDLLEMAELLAALD